MVKILKNNTKLRLGAPPPFRKKTRYKIQVYKLEGFEYEKISLLVGDTTKFHASVMNLAYVQLTGCTSVMHPPRHWQCCDDKQN